MNANQRYESDDDSKSTGGDSGFSVGEDEHRFKTEKPSNFVSRIASFPIVHDSISGCQNVVRQHAVGQKALDYAEATFSSISRSSYLSTDLISRVNTFGNKSLDIVEKQFPILSAPTDQIIQPFTNVKARIGFAVSQLKEKEQAVVNPRLEYVADQLECLLDQYLPSHQEQQDEKLVGAQRLYSLANTLSARMSQKVAQTTKTTEEEERQVKEMIRSWIMEQSSSISQQQWPVLKEQLRNRVVAPIQTMYQFTQFEMDRFKQEFTKPDLTHMDRARNILQLSQKDLFIPILQKCHIC